MLRSLVKTPFRGASQSVIRFASLYIPPRSPILSSLPPLSFSASKPTSILQTPNLVPTANEVTLKLPNINSSSISKLPDKDLRIAIEVEIVGDEIKFEIVDAGGNNNEMLADSVLRKRRLKMKKHKYKKRRKAQRALRKRLGNANKLKEVTAILSTSSEESNKVGKFCITNKSIDLDEVQGTIEEVTIHKAKSAAEQINGPVLVEDTCLGFNAYNDLPGPYIKWFVKLIGLQGLVKMLAGFEDKGANAICTFGYCEGPGKEVKIFQGRTQGTIVDSRGPTDFGWDSVFQPIGYDQTYAEMDKSVKNTISHRYRALDKVRDYLVSL